MKKIIIVISFAIFFISCGDKPENTNCLPFVSVRVNTDLNNPSLINVQTPGGFAYVSGGIQGILLFNINSERFVALDRKCPNKDCDKPMIVKNGLTLQCPCDDSQYSIHFHGAPQTKGSNCPALEYKVVKNGTNILITNF